MQSKTGRTTNYIGNILQVTKNTIKENKTKDLFTIKFLKGCFKHPITKETMTPKTILNLIQLCTDSES